MKVQHTINADLQALASLQDLLEPVLEGFSSDEIGQVVLAVHELCVNIITHGYAHHAGTIQLEFSRERNGVQIQIIDDAPVVYNAPDVVVPPDPLDLPEGGWGLYIIHQVMDRFEHQRLHGKNHWHLYKNM